jgi:hypothetical protein
MKCTRQRCHDALNTFVIAALRPTCESEMTSFTPRTPLRLKLRRNSVQKGSASLGPTARPSNSRVPSVFTPTAIITAIETIRPDARTFTYAASIHRYGQIAFDRTVEKGIDTLVDLSA